MKRCLLSLHFVFIKPYSFGGVIFLNIYFIKFVTTADQHLPCEGVEDCRLHDVVPAGKLSQTVFLDYSIVYVSIFLKMLLYYI